MLMLLLVVFGSIANTNVEAISWVCDEYTRNKASYDRLGLERGAPVTIVHLKFKNISDGGLEEFATSLKPGIFKFDGAVGLSIHIGRDYFGFRYAGLDKNEYEDWLTGILERQNQIKPTDYELTFPPEPFD